MPAKIPESVYIERINALPNIRFVRWRDGYNGARSKAVCRCDVDGFEWPASVSHLIHNGRGCPRCAELLVADKLRTPSYKRINQINTLPNISFVRWDGEYRNVHSKAICRCAVDGFEWSVSAHNIINGARGCPQCSGKRRWTSSERAEQINALQGIKFVRWKDGEYKNNNSKAVCRCDVGHEWPASVNSISSGKGCPQCADSGYDKAKPGTLYALRSECGSMVKIGISNDYKTRHKTLERATPFKWQCIELVHGDGGYIADLEKRIHDETERVEFSEKFDGYTEWRKWDERVRELLADAHSMGAAA